jgi:ATP-binding protein involved in chromosome partitioning
MSELSVQNIEKILSEIKYPGFSRDILSFGVINNIDIQENKIQIKLKFTSRNEEIITQVREQIQAKMKEVYPDTELEIIEASVEPPSTNKTAPSSNPWSDLAPIPGIRNIIAVASGKGGVGKSTVSTNLAITLSQSGRKVGLMDSDIYGPSIHIMMGVEERPMVDEAQKILPIEKFGIKLMSMGFLIDSDAPLIWRGPLVMKAVEQFLRDVVWGELDYLVIDLPPGTGDAQLTLVQKTPLTGAIIVTTPQEVALVDARRALKMFNKVETPVLGLVENMSYFSCPHCGEQTYIFGKDGGGQAAKDLEVNLLGRVPIESQVTEAGDQGVPIVIRDKNSASAKAFFEISENVVKKMSAQ